MREHLRAGTRERESGRAHHSSRIDGYIGLPKFLKHGESYTKKVAAGTYRFNEIHGVTDGVIDGEDHKIAPPTYATLMAKDETGSRRPINRAQRLNPEYIRPTLR